MVDGQNKESIEAVEAQMERIFRKQNKGKVQQIKEQRKTVEDLVIVAKEKSCM